ncbi:diguanylate cyclase [Rhizobium helianthi]|uniref:diguanylate cyclase n=1 Tax=Rhizobium helianthi TaxID=1132695 RepID=A0ABW4M2S7_9HYPH
MNKFSLDMDSCSSRGEPEHILLVEDSASLANLMRGKLEARLNAIVHIYRSFNDTQNALQQQEFTLAVTGLNLPDAPNGEILDLLAQSGVPTILFSASIVEDLAKNYAARRLIDYIVKEGQSSVDRVVAAAGRIIENRSVSILVVDDMNIMRSDLVGFLKRQNFRVHSATTGRDALQIMQDDPSIELVLTDYFMPDMDGFELTKEIRARHGSDRIRIIGISSSSDRHLSASFLKAGASDFLYRPFLPEELQCRIDNNVETLLQLKRLRYLAERDPLTSLYNRRAFFERAAVYVEQLRDDQESGTVAILDIDHFKRINDSYGHETGDRVLRTMASLLREEEQQRGILPARLGGEEFVLLFPKRNSETAQQQAETLLKRVRTHAFASPEGVFRLTASVGMVALVPGETLDNQLNGADQMLYLAKKNGRDRICSDQTLEDFIISS